MQQLEIEGELLDFINSLEPIEYSSFDGRKGSPISKFIAEVKTKSGWHLITKPFNIQKFKEKYPDIDVHKNNPTLLYCL